MNLPVNRRPNFFILGAPKCATTSMVSWLQTHPQVFLPPIKEPHFFNADDRRHIRTLDAYERLFSASTSGHHAIGEASVWYLFSRVAVANILAYQPLARFIVMLRNPIEMAAALHSEMLLSGHENVRDFHKAWLLQDLRRSGQMVPALTWATRRLQYGAVCSLGAQLKRLLAAVARERVLTITLDDIATNPRQVYLRVLHFLGLDDDGRIEFPALNKSRSVRWPRLVRTLFLLGELKTRSGINVRSGLLQHLISMSFKESPRQIMAPATRDMLHNYFADDIHLLGELLGCDLGYWLNAEVHRDCIAEASTTAMQPFGRRMRAIAGCS